MDRPLPPYRYVPGLQAHPLRGGHGGCGLTPEDDAQIAWDRGLDLLGCRYPWEAHEAFEHAWLQWREVEPVRGEAAAGMAKIGASWLRMHAGDRQAAARLLDRARVQIAPLEDPVLNELVAETARFLDGGPWPTWPLPISAA